MKITKTFIERAVHALSRRALNDRFEANKIARQQVGQRIYDLLYPADVQALMKSLPSGAFQRINSLRIDGEGCSYTNAILPSERPVFSAHQYGVINAEDGSALDVAIRLLR